MRRFVIGRAFSCFISLILSLTAFADDLAQGFQTPPSDTHLGCYWYFLKDDVTKEGITKDLEAMARVGIRRAQIGYINQGANPPGDNRVFRTNGGIGLSTRLKKETGLALRSGSSTARAGRNRGGPGSPLSVRCGTW